MPDNSENKNTDPFGKDAVPASEPSHEKNRPPLKPSKKIAYAAAATAIASVASVITVYLPVRIMPLVLASFCFFLAAVKCGIVYGIIAAAATALITFACGGLSTSFILLCVCFFPYSLLCFFLKKFGYRKPLHALIRALSAIALANAALVAAYFIAKYTVLTGMDIVAGVGKAGYAAAAVMVSVAALITDFLFVLCDKVITPKIK